MQDWDLPDPHVIEVRVGPEHVDGLGHVNNAVYVGWCGRVAWSHTRAEGLDLAAYRRLDRAMVVRETRLVYLQAAFEGDELQVANWIVHSDGRLRVTRRYQIRRPADGRTLLRGYSKFVCMALTSGRPKRMPAEFSAAYVVPPRVAEAIRGSDGLPDFS